MSMHREGEEIVFNPLKRVDSHILRTALAGIRLQKYDGQVTEAVVTLGDKIEHAVYDELPYSMGIADVKLAVAGIEKRIGAEEVCEGYLLPPAQTAHDNLSDLKRLADLA